MGTRGNTFDGLSNVTINTESNANALYYNAKASDLQYRTDGTDMEFKTSGTNPTFNFKNTLNDTTLSNIIAGSATLANTLTAETIGATDLTLTNKFTTAKAGNTITTNATDTTSGLTISGSINGESVSSLQLTRANHGRILNLNRSVTTTNTNSTPLIYVTDNSIPNGTSLPMGQLYAPNLGTNQRSEIYHGKDVAANINGFYTGFYYVGSGNDANYYTIRALGYSPSVYIHRQGLLGTTPSSNQTLRVDGDFGVYNTIRTPQLALHQTATSTGYVLLKPGPASSTYTIQFPSATGNANDYLQIASISSGVIQLQWAPITSQASVLYYNSTTAVSATTGGVTTAFFYDFNQFSQNVMTTYTQLTTGYPYYFRYDGSGTAYYFVVAEITMTTSGTGASTDYMKIQILKATGLSQSVGSSVVYAETRTLLSASSSQITSMQVSAIVPVTNGQCFFAAYATNRGVNYTPRFYYHLLGSTGGGGVGAQSVTLSSSSTFLTGSGTSSGTNPSVTVGLANTPTGTGTTLVASVSPTITTPTLTSPTITGTLSTAAISSSSSVTSSSLSTSALYENSIEFDIASTTSYTLTSANTSVFIFGTGASNFTLTLPSTAVLNEGIVLRITNNTTNRLINVNNSSSTLIDTIQIGQATNYMVLSTSTQSWREISILDKEKIEQRSSALLLKNGVGLSLTGSSSANLASIQAAPSTTTFDFILPTSLGTSGQLLTSQGAGAPLVWSNTSATSPLSISTVGSYIGNSTTSVTTTPLLQIDGVTNTNSAGNPLVLIRNYAATTDTTPLDILSPNLASGLDTTLHLGKSLTTYNAAKLVYFHDATGSSLNYASLGLFNRTDSIRIYDTGRTASSGSGTLVVTGGIACESLYSTGALSATTLTASSSISAATSVSAQNVVVSDKNSSFGTSTTLVTTAPIPILLVEGKDSTDNTFSMLKVNNYNSTLSNTTIGAYAPNLSTGQSTFIRFGRTLLSRDSGVLGFGYISSGSSSNYISLSLRNETETLKVYQSSNASTSSTSGSVTVSGGVGCTSLGTNSLYINGNDYTPTGGTQADLTLSWSYSTNDPTTTNLQYPAIPYQTGASTGTIPNQRYYWQQIGKSYTFSLNFYCTTDNTSAQIHLLYIYSPTHDPPIPACGSYNSQVSFDSGSTESYASTVKFGLGVYIPAMYFYY